ncbi:MAG: hypothetical protein E6J34_11435 [Chloroflexi bacterium]|nr:MAG: hypothetical protein E6J34_11435 [Chloroflexota bacterium]
MQAFIGPNVALRSRAGSRVGPRGRGNTAQHTAVRPPATNGNGSATPRKIPSYVHVNTHTLDFGELYPGISAPQELIISGSQGMLVRGHIYATDPWILVDQTQFDDAIAHINVHIDSTALRSGHHTGSIIIIPDYPGAKKIVVVVEADVLGYSTTQHWPRRGGKTIGADLDDDEDYGYDDLTMGGTMIQVRGSAMYASVAIDPDEPTEQAPITGTYKQEDITKYGQPNSRYARGSEPLQITARQQQWFKQGSVLFSAFMLGSLSNSFVHVLPANPAFILVLVLMIVTTTLGALFVNRDHSWTRADMVNRAYTGAGAVLLILAITRCTWQFAVRINLTWPLFLIMLLVAALAATAGTNPLISDRMVNGISWLLTYTRKLVIVLAALVGAGLGAMLTLPLSAGWSMLLAALAGLAVVLFLVLRVDYLMR